MARTRKTGTPPPSIRRRPGQDAAMASAPPPSAPPPPGPAATESAVVVPVPEAEAAVGRLRARLDSAAALGVPAHVTVLFPFAAPPDLTGATVDRLAAAVASVPEFGCAFRRCAWFGDQVLWLAPEPDGPFRALTEAVAAALPGYLPYGGAHADVIPHLTVGHQPAGRAAELRAAASDVLGALPVTARISGAWLMEGRDAAGSWRRVADLPLGRPG
jgi:2'-5' RNA ligase